MTCAIRIASLSGKVDAPFPPFRKVRMSLADTRRGGVEFGLVLDLFDDLLVELRQVGAVINAPLQVRRTTTPHQLSPPWQKSNSGAKCFSYLVSARPMIRTVGGADGSATSHRPPVSVQSLNT